MMQVRSTSLPWTPGGTEATAERADTRLPRRRLPAPRPAHATVRRLAFSNAPAHRLASPRAACLEFARSTFSAKTERATVDQRHLATSPAAEAAASIAERADARSLARPGRSARSSVETSGPPSAPTASPWCATDAHAERRPAIVSHESAAFAGRLDRKGYTCKCRMSFLSSGFAKGTRAPAARAASAPGTTISL
jgi:hypothetical protein